MADRPIAFEGANPVLIGALLLLGTATAFVWVGPGIAALDRGRAAIEEKQARLTTWDQERQAADQITPDQRSRWSENFERARTLGVVAPDEASLMARVARRLAAPSVRGLEVARNGSVEDDDAADELLELRQPFGRTKLAFRRVPLRVRFDANYADVKWVLERLAPRASGGITLHRVELKRQFPNVRVELEMDVWTREEAES